MSINDLLDSEIVIPAMMVIFVIISIFAIPVGVAIGKKTNNNIFGDNESSITSEEKNAKVIARRITPHPLNSAVMLNMIVFELANGNRIELAIKDTDIYGTIIEGDCGTLKHQGKKFISFERSI